MNTLRIIIIFMIFVKVRLVPIKNATVLTSTYAKVAKWGITNIETTIKPVQEGRSNGQTLFTQRSDVSIRKTIPKEVVYHYSMNSRVGQDKKEHFPSKGEVIQERFNPRPYFDYAPDPGHHNHQNSQQKPPSIVYSSSYAPSPTKVDAPPSLDSYNSPISSYNRAPSGVPDDIKPTKSESSLYPPNGNKFGPTNFYTNTGGYSYNPPKDMKKPEVPKFPSYVYEKPEKTPDAPTKFPSYVYEKPDKTPDVPTKFPSYVYEKPDNIPDAPSTNQKYPGPYAPIDDDDEKHHDYMPPPSGDDDKGPPISQVVDSPMDSSYDELTTAYDNDHDHKPLMDGRPAPSMSDSAGADADLSPPPSGAASGFPKNIPEYLDHDPSHDPKYAYDVPYNFDEHHHHVYHEVKPTTTEAPEDERVNKGHYSYYYLGRKLWYIPLYFSVYFIVYITVLILKSIARHKVNFAHDVHDKFKSRKYDLRRNDLNDLTANVAEAIGNTKKRYLAM